MSTHASSWRDFEYQAMSPVQEAALDAFAEHGYDGTSVRDIAKRSGISVGGLYYHYDNKQAMLVDLLQRSVEDVYSRACVAIAEVGPDHVAQLDALVEILCLYMAHRRKVASIGGEMSRLSPDNRQRYVAIRDAFEGLFSEVVGSGVSAGMFGTDEPEQAARAIITMCRGIALWYRPDGEATPEEIARIYQRFAADIVETNDRTAVG